MRYRAIAEPIVLSRMTTRPLLSILMPLKNGMPYVRDAVRSLAVQTYRSFEVIVQDGGSTDGSLDCLRAVQDLPHVDIASAMDAGIGQACNRALQRCRGEIIGTLCSDDAFEPNALEFVVRTLNQHPDCAVLFGSVKMVNSRSKARRIYAADPFDLVRFMQCEHRAMPPMAATFFSRALCGNELRFDESMKTCSDYDLLLRLGHLRFLKVRTCLARVRIGAQSQTCRPDMYEQFCRDKIDALERYLHSRNGDVLMQELRKQAVAGICAWAASSMLWIPDGTKHFAHWYERAAAVAPDSKHVERLQLLREISSGRCFSWQGLTVRGQLFLRKVGQALQWI